MKEYGISREKQKNNGVQYDKGCCQRIGAGLDLPKQMGKDLTVNDHLTKDTKAVKNPG
jgi:hypothetical protein